MNESIYAENTFKDDKVRTVKASERDANKPAGVATFVQPVAIKSDGVLSDFILLSYSEFIFLHKSEDTVTLTRSDNTEIRIEGKHILAIQYYNI